MLTAVRSRSSSFKDRLYWLCQLVGWGLYTATNLAAAVVVLHLPLGAVAIDLLILSAIGLVVSHALRAYIRAHRWAARPWGPRLGRVVLASSVLGVLIAAVKVLLRLAPWQTGDFPPELAPLQRYLVFLVPALNWTFLLLVWCALYFGALALRAHKSAQLRESELARALQLSELRRLKSQLNPHYLFNALNTVRALVAIDPAAAQQAVTQLARTLRYTLGAGQDELVSLDQELATVEDYLALESLRFGERLRIERDLAPETMSVRVPVMLLQTVVENAIKHGIAELPAGGDLRILAALRGGTLHIDVENTRPERIGKVFRGEGDGVGLDNATERLRLLFGAEARLELDLSHAELAIARIRIPETV
jgi:hypothetical protein